MKVFITGGAGFIGSHLCDTFVANGDSVSILDNLSTGSEENILHLKGKIEVFNGDIRDKSIVEELTKNSDVVIHMAAALGVENILRKTKDSISTNFTGSEVVLNSALKFEKRILIASTSEIYGKNPKQPLSEVDDRVIGSPQKLRWTYSDAKALEEALAYSLYLTDQLRVTTFRLFNTVGPRQTGKYGMVIPRFVNSAIRNEPLVIFGDGSQTRVFCHVFDSIKAILSILNNDKSIGEVFNIGGEGEISILELAKKIILILDSKSEIIFKEYSEAYPTGFEDMQRRIPDISKIKKFTDWSPSLDLNSIILDVATSLNHSNLGQP